MANDHFISQFLTKWWEVQPGRMLHYFDFETASFDAKPSKYLFADDGLHTSETGKLLNDLVEQPVAQHLRVLETNPLANITDTGSWPTYRALASLWLLQSQRISEAKTPGALAMTLDQLLARGEELVNGIGMFARENFQVLVAKTPERLFFTEAGSFPLPLVGAISLALPLSPHHFLTLVRRDAHEPETGIREMMKTGSMLTALSVGVGSNVHKVILPPEIAPMTDEDRARLREGMLLFRSTTRRLVDLLGEASAAIGFPTWKVK